MPLYVGLFGALAGGLSVVSAVAGAFASAEEYPGRSSGSERVNLRARLAARRTAHPLAFRIQIVCLAGACILLLPSLAY